MNRSIRWRFAQFLELWWWKRYLFGKDKAKYYDWKKNYWRRFLSTYAIEVPEGIPVLDAGCGPAGIFTVLDKNEVCGVDPLLAHYEQNLPHFQPQDWPWVVFTTASLEYFASERLFPVVFCLNAINHIDHLEKGMAQLSRLTAPGGRLYLSVDAHRTDWLRKLCRIIPIDVLHPHQQHIREYTTQLEKQGFKVLQVSIIKKSWVFNYYLVIAQKV